MPPKTTQRAAPARRTTSPGALPSAVVASTRPSPVTTRSKRARVESDRVEHVAPLPDTSSAPSDASAAPSPPAAPAPGRCRTGRVPWQRRSGVRAPRSPPGPLPSGARRGAARRPASRSRRRRRERAPAARQTTSRSPAPASTVAVPPSASTMPVGPGGERASRSSPKPAARRARADRAVRDRAGPTPRRPRRPPFRPASTNQRAPSPAAERVVDVRLSPLAARASQSDSAVPSPPSATGSSTASAPVARSPSAERSRPQRPR